MAVWGLLLGLRDSSARGRSQAQSVERRHAFSGESWDWTSSENQRVVPALDNRSGSGGVELTLGETWWSLNGRIVASDAAKATFHVPGIRVCRGGEVVCLEALCDQSLTTFVNVCPPRWMSEAVSLGRKAPATQRRAAAPSESVTRQRVKRRGRCATAMHSDKARRRRRRPIFDLRHLGGRPEPAPGYLS